MMKTKTVLVIIITSFLFFGCNNSKVDLINNEFPDKKKEIKNVLDIMVEAINKGDIDKLISLHAYSSKFTEFKNGEVRNGAKENELHERNVFGAITEVLKFDLNDLTIAVYGDVANVTFHSDFHLMFGDDKVIVNDQITLLLVKTNKGWKCVHEHHSPLKV